ncbi:MAG: hypothetical protein AB7D28_06240 [Candidatus Berkiella sp.]
MNVVIRSNYGDESIALIQWFHQHKAANIKNIFVCYINTGWAAQNWHQQVERGEALAKHYGFQVVHLDAPYSFASLAKQRNSVPTPKFQWCAGFLKGIPFLQWLDEKDPAGEWLVALPKRQAIYRKIVPEYIEHCEHHGDRTVWHPLLNLDNEQRNVLLKAAGFSPLNHRSLECDPCVNSSLLEIKNLAKLDQEKVEILEADLNQPFFPKFNKNIQLIIREHLTQNAHPKMNLSAVEAPMMDKFSMGCGDPFGCGL